MINSELEQLAMALGCSVEELAAIAANGELEMELKDTYTFKHKLYDYRADELAELKREQRGFGRSRLAQFGKTFTQCQCAKLRPYWMRIRSFCVRSPYG